MHEKIKIAWYAGPPVDIGLLPPCVTVVGYPPLPGEGSRAYQNRVQAEVFRALFAPKPTLFERIRAHLFASG